MIHYLVALFLLAVALVAWFAIRQEARNVARMRIQLLAWQEMANDRAARLERLNNEAITSAKRSLAQSRECVERAERLLQSARRGRDRTN